MKLSIVLLVAVLFCSSVQSAPITFEQQTDKYKPSVGTPLVLPNADKVIYGEKNFFCIGECSEESLETSGKINKKAVVVGLLAVAVVSWSLSYHKCCCNFILNPPTPSGILPPVSRPPIDTPEPNYLLISLPFLLLLLYSIRYGHKLPYTNC